MCLKLGMEGIVVLLSICAYSAVATHHGHLQAEFPVQMASRLVDESCNAENYTAFYLHIRDMENMTRRFPVWPNGIAVAIVCKESKERHHY